MPLSSPLKRALWLFIPLLGLIIFYLGRETLSWKPVLFAHSGMGPQLTVSPDGHFLVAGAKIFDAATGQLIGQTKYEAPCQFSKDGSKIAFATYLNNYVTLKNDVIRVTIYALPNCKKLSERDFKFPSRWRNYGPYPSISSDLRTLWYLDKGLDQWDIATGRRLHTTPSKSKVDDDGGWTITPDGTYLIIGFHIYASNRDQIRTAVFRTSDGQQVRSISLNERGSTLMALSADSLTLCSLAADGSTDFSDFKTGRKLWSHYIIQNSITFSHSSRYFVTYEDDLKLAIREARTGKKVRDLIAPRIGSNFSNVEWTPDDHYVFATDHPGNIWKIRAQ